MPWSHVRLRFWDSERYTDAQAAELRELCTLYTSHLMPVFNSGLPDAFALRTEGNYYYPRYTANTLTPVTMTAVPPSSTLPTDPYKDFADTLISTLEEYEEGRYQRWTRRGHPNDPARLFGIFLRNLCNGWLSHAPSTENTLRQVIALRQYLEALVRRNVFTAEARGQGSMTRLLHNLVTPLSLLEKRLLHEIRLQSAREHFSAVKEGVTHILGEAAQFLFCALAAKDRTHLPFSLVNMQARVVNKDLTKALKTREGTVLKQWIYSPGVIRTLLPQMDAKTSSRLLIPKPVSLLKSKTLTPLLDEKGVAHATWVDFLQKNGASEAQLEPSVKKLPSGICPVFTSNALSEEESILPAFVQLQGLLQSLATYQDYLHQCWQLAGFGGDNCVYDEISAAVASIFTELRVFNQALSTRLASFQDHLDLGYKHALEEDAYLEWQRNYCAAKASGEKLLGMLIGCEAALTRVIAHAEDTAARAERRRAALKAYQTLKSAPHFLNQVRQQIGLPPKENYRGLEAVPDSKALIAADLSLPDMPLDQVWRVLLPRSPKSVVWLNKLCAETPTTPPWSVFRGTCQRYVYLHDNTRLKSIAQKMHHLQWESGRSLTREKALLIQKLREQLYEEQNRIEHLRHTLWWGVHRASRAFFDECWAAMQANLDNLSKWGDLSQALSESTEVVSPSFTSSQEVLVVQVTPAERAKIRRDWGLDEPALPYQELAPENQRSLSLIYGYYGSAALSVKELFDTWCRKRFKGQLLWDAQGALLFDLTEKDVSDIVDQWALQSLECRRVAALPVEAMPSTQPSPTVDLTFSAI